MLRGPRATLSPQASREVSQPPLLAHRAEGLMPQPARVAAFLSPRCSPVADGCGKGSLEQAKERGQGAVAGGGGGAESCFPCGVSCSPPIVRRRP